MKITLEVNLASFRKLKYKITDKIKSWKFRYKLWREKKERDLHSRMKIAWIKYLETVYKIDIPGLLSSVSFVRVGFRKYSILSTVGRGYYLGECRITLLGRYKMKHSPTGVVQVILMSRGIELDFIDKCVVFFNSQVTEAIRPCCIRMIHMTSTLEFETANGSKYTASFKHAESFLPFVFDTCKRFLE